MGYAIGCFFKDGRFVVSEEFSTNNMSLSDVAYWADGDVKLTPDVKEFVIVCVDQD